MDYYIILLYRSKINTGVNQNGQVASKRVDVGVIAEEKSERKFAEAPEILEKKVREARFMYTL